ncbi:MAG: polyprenol monophosphomannose synthase [Bacteroidetes bacterium]|nr:polyprenol monophosphomannose synthase [Bacteroidota bacterium]
MRTIVIIPTYNEIENISSIITSVLGIVSDINILIVDDNSPDGTAAAVEKMMQNDPRIHIIKRAGKLGLGTAYCDGFRYCIDKGFDYIFEMDADFSHDPNEIPNFLDAIKDNDLVIGSRYLTGMNVVNWPLRRLILSYGASLYTRIITCIPIKDTTGGFKCFRTEMLKKINLDKIRSNGYGFQIEMNYKVWKKGGRIKEIPIIFEDRRSGNSKMNKKIVFEALLLVWKLRFIRKKNM